MSSPTLFTAVEQGNLQAVNALLQAGADSNTRNAEEMTPLMVAAGLGHMDIVETLLDQGANVNARNTLGWTALMKAIYNYEQDTGFPEIISALIAAGAEFENQIAYGTRPLMLAAGYGQAEVIAVLLAAGADVMAKNEGGFTARTMAEYKDYVQVINLLYEAEIIAGTNPEGACSTRQPAGGAQVIQFAPHAKN
ncbi:MAG TPA: ankyrin repeat domain-containing protein [Gallionellaceae bacterium]|nr:ankyrin repeat domain-containing protein [Gallionellaceae bacterium]